MRARNQSNHIFGSLPIIATLLAAVSFFVFSKPICPLALEIPQNLQEKSYIEQFFITQSVGHNESIHLNTLGANLRKEYRAKMNQMLNAKDELARLRGKQGADLIYQYITMAYPKKARCDVQTVSEYAMLIRFHENSPAVLKYLRYHAGKQFSMCKHDWDVAFLQLCSKLNEEMMETLEWLVDGLMARNSQDQESSRSQRPYSRSDLRAMLERPRLRGIAEYMAQMGDLDIDKRGKISSTLTYEHFLRATEPALMPLCRHLCQVIGPQTAVYNYINDPSLGVQVEPREDNEETEIYVYQWLAYTKLACKIVNARDGSAKNRSNNILRLAFESVRG